MKDRASIQSGLSPPLQQAAFNAATAGHSEDWLQVLPITLCGLKLDDEAVRVSVGIRWHLCVPHQRRCDSQVDSLAARVLSVNEHQVEL